jgi:hypothetical protein
MAVKLKKAYLDEAKRDQILAEIENGRKKLNTNVEQLREKQCISIDDVDTLKAVSAEWCRRYVNDAEEGYLKNLSPFVVRTVQDDIHSKFAAAYDAAAPLCSEIRNILNRWKFNIKIDSKGHFWFDEKEAKEFAAELATIHYSDDEVEFCNKVSEIIEMINEFEKWAEAKGFEPFFTEQRSIIWNGGTVVQDVILQLTDTEMTNSGGVNIKNHLTFNAEVFRSLLNSGWINQVR